MMSERESMPYDVVIVGAGPAGLSAAIRLKQLANEKGSELSVCVLEKGSEVGAHILSGAVVDPKGLDELIPDWRDKGCPLAEVPVTDNQHWVLSKTGKFGLPHFITPPFMHNKGTYTGSLGNLCRWLAGQAEELGVEIFPGFAAAEILFNDDGSVKGVATGDMGVARDGTHKPDYTPGLELHAKYTFFARRRARASDQGTDPHLRSRAGCAAAGLWPRHQGIVGHQAGEPRPRPRDPHPGLAADRTARTAAGSSIIRPMARSRSASSPGSTTPTPISRRSRRCSAGRRTPRSRRCWRAASASPMARARSAMAGSQSVPKLVFPGGALIGDSAGFLNVPRIKGSHTAIKSGMMAAEAAFEAIAAGRSSDELTAYPAAFEKSWVKKELSIVRNVVPLVKRFGDFIGSGLAGITMWLEYLGLKMPFTLKHHPDHESLWRKDQVAKIDYPKPDGVLTFDRLSSVFLSNTNHEEDQPVHLTLKDPDVPVAYDLPLYDEPAQRYCPAGVYEIVGEDDRRAEIRDQRAELRSLQDVRHQGPDPEYQLGGARRRRRTELSEHVIACR